MPLPGYSAREGGAEGGEFFVNERIGGGLERVCDRLAQEGAEALAQAENGLADGVRVKTRGLRDGGIVAFRLWVEERAEGFKKRCAAARFVFCAEEAGRIVETGDGPCVVEGGGGGIECRGAVVARFGIDGLERHKAGAAAAFLPGGAAVGVDKIALECGEEEGAEASAVRRGAGEEVTGRDSREEVLGGVFRVLRAPAFLPREGVKRKPVEPAEFVERGTGLRAVAGSCQDNTPTGRRKLRRADTVFGHLCRRLPNPSPADNP